MKSRSEPSRAAREKSLEVSRRAAVAMVFVAASAASLYAQSSSAKKLEFDVASVKQNKSGDPPAGDQPYANIPTGPGNVYTPNGGYFVARNLPLAAYISFAWKMSTADIKYLVPQLPAWVMSDHFDVQARAQSNPGKDEMRLMMRSLLEERFKLAIHNEKREIPVSAMLLLKAGKTGPQLQLHPADAECSSQNDPAAPPQTSVPTVAGGFPVLCGGIYLLPPQMPGNQRLAARNITLDFLARSLPANETDRPLVNRTGVTAPIDFVMEWLPARNGLAQPAVQSETDASGPSFQEALAKQLGIRLESQRALTDVLVFDHIEHLSEN